MLPRWIVVVAAGVLLSGCSLSSKKSGIEIMSTPVAKVFINDKEAGMTPYKNNTLKPGEIDIKLVLNDKSWSKRVHLENGANTVISREFGNNESSGGGYTLYFESTGDTEKAGLLLSSTPDRATISIDDEIKGFSPLRLENVGEGDKRLKISYPGHKSANSFVKLLNGYQLVVEAELPAELVSSIDTEVPASTQPPSNIENTKMIMILNTETGWLRVRTTSNSSSAEVARVKPGEKFKLLEESADWIKIDLGNGKAGWISSKYAEKVAE